MACGPARTSPTAWTGERTVEPVLAAQRLETAAELGWRRSRERSVAEEEGERRGHMDLIGRGMDLVHFLVG